MYDTGICRMERLFFNFRDVVHDLSYNSSQQFLYLSMTNVILHANFVGENITCVIFAFWMIIVMVCPRGWGELPIVDYMGTLRPKGVPFFQAVCI